MATTATAYVQGLERSGIVATLKHFAGYSTSRGARNLAPATAGRRELLDVIFPPFEMAVVEGGVRSIMQAYNDIDGVPVAASQELLTGVLRDEWGFDGTVVADYFAIGFLKLLHGVAETWGDAARLALTAGIDVEMPNMDGLALTASIRANPATAELPVILVTSLQTPEQREAGLRAGADAYFTKGSFDQDRLLATVRRVAGMEAS